MIIRPYVFSDYMLMERQPEQEWVPSTWGLSHIEYAKLFGRLHNATTVIIDEKIVLIGGIGFNSGWAGEGGFIVCKDFREVFRKNSKELIKNLRKYLDKSGFNMVYSAIDPDIDGAEKLAKLLGFKFINQIKNLGSEKKAMNLYLRIVEC